MKKKTKVYVGMDVHKDSVMIAVLPEGEREPTLVRRLSHERRKHDGKDAEELSRLYRAGELVTIRIPSEREERVRDLVRCRETFQREALKSRHYILKFLARRGLVYREGQNWTGRHFAWLRAIQRDELLEAEDHRTFSEYLALLDYKLDRRGELDRDIEALALEPACREAVGRLCCLKGISTRAAMVPVTEIGDFRRFEHPGKLMAYVGLVPTEHSSGGSRRQGSITKAGNSRVRHVLVQAAWNYRYPPRRSAVLKRRQQGRLPDAAAHGWKAQHRLHKVYKRLAFRKNSKIAAVAVARELAGFIWALMQEGAAEIETGRAAA